MRQMYFTTRDKLVQHKFSIKQAPCPFCQRIGTVILHGYLFGYDEGSVERRVKRGQRFFCSTRRQQAGCGRTFSVLYAHFFQRRTVQAQTLWRFLRSFLEKKNVIQAFKGIPFSISSAYRWITEIRSNQHWIRPFIFSREQQRLKNNRVTTPLYELIKDLDASSVPGSCPITAFQLQFQRPFLPC